MRSTTFRIANDFTRGAGVAEPFIGEIRIFSFNYVPTTQGWAQCNGQLLPINQNQALFSLFGTTYGGDGRTTFALPDLRGRVPIHVGQGFTQGERGGEQAHTLSIAEIPTHTHVVNASSNDATVGVAAGNLLARAAPANPYIAPTNVGALNPGTCGNTGGSQAHLNMQPFLALTFGVALQGIFPSQN
jgi:microcystin-dependent protein